MQNVICAVRDCGFCSINGFCLNKLVVINCNGVCKWLSKPGWDQKQNVKNAGARSNPDFN